MKLLRCFLMILAFGASISSAQARDSFSLGISIGGYSPYGHPGVTYHAVPQVIYYDAPRIYHSAPVVVHRDVYYGGAHNYYSAPGYHIPRHHGFQGYYGGHRGHGHHGHHGHRGHHR